MHRRQHVKDAIKPPCILHVIPSEFYLQHHCFRVGSDRIDEALKLLSSVPSTSSGKPYLVSAVYDHVANTGYGYTKSYTICVRGMELYAARSMFPDMPSRRPAVIQYRTVDIVAAAVYQVRCTGRPYRRQVDDPHLNTSFLVHREIVGSAIWNPLVMERLPLASSLLKNIRDSKEPLPSKVISKASTMDYVLASDVRAVSDVVRFIGNNSDADVLVDSL